MARILPQVNYGFGFLTSGPCLGGVTGRGPNHLFYLDVLLSLNEDTPNLNDIILHQIFVKGIGDLQPIDKGGNNHILIVVVH